MYQASGFAGVASKRYAAIHAGSRTEGASPHALVKLLFDELMLAMDACALALDHGDAHKANDRHIRALSILYALDSSLDFNKGGDIAISLAQIYRETRRLLLVAFDSRMSADVRRAHALIAEIADAWNNIG